MTWFGWLVGWLVEFCFWQLGCFKVLWDPRHVAQLPYRRLYLARNNKKMSFFSLNFESESFGTPIKIVFCPFLFFQGSLILYYYFGLYFV